MLVNIDHHTHTTDLQKTTDHQNRSMGGRGSIKKLLSCDEVDAVYTEPFILHGYRRPHTSLWETLQYAFILHNDVGNFWTHFTPLLLWLGWFWLLATSQLNFFQPYHYPLMCFWAGSCSYALFSSVAHLFSSVSFEVRTVCFMLDYLGIAMYALGGGIVGLFYLNPCSSQMFAHKPFILFLQVCLAISATLFCSLSRFFWHDYRFVIRTCSFVLPYLCVVQPFFHRLSICWQYGTDCVPETLFLHGLAMLLTILLTFFFVSKLPERLAPGQFDYFFQSHQLFHVCSACLTCVQMYFIPWEMVLRRQALSQVEGTMPSWETTFLPYVCAQVGGLLVVCVLGVLVQRGVLTTNKHRRKKE